MQKREPTIDSLVRRAVQEFGLIQPGDRVLVAASGGKDSTVLAWALSRLWHAMDRSFTLQALHITTDLGVNAPLPQLRPILEGWKIPLAEYHVGVRERLKPGRSMNCYWCSTQRRKELMDWGIREGYTKLALGHHLDDILETLLMNMMAKSELSTMPVLMPYDKFAMTIIRPLALVEERQIIDFVRREGLDSVTCTCPFGSNSFRKDVRRRIAVLTEGIPGAKLHMLRSLAHPRTDYLPGFPAHPPRSKAEETGEAGEAGEGEARC